MAFLDENGKVMSITDEIQKLEAVVSENKNTAEGFYLELGKKYYDAIKSNCDNDCTELVDAIQKCNDIIESSQQQITTLKKIKVCNNCGAEIIEGADFCIKCGSRVTEDEPKQPEVKVEEKPVISNCPNCNAPLSKDAVFCTECGERVDGYIIADKPADNSCCTVCGLPLAEGTRFCTNCGSERKN